MATVLEQVKTKIKEAKENNQDVSELDLSTIKIGKFTPQINAVLEKNKNLTVLYLVECGLTTLEGFPNIKLEAVDLSTNEIGDDSSVETLTRFSNLTQVVLADNKIEKIETVLKLSTLQKLVDIDFQGNPVSELANFSSTIFEKFSSIEYVNRKDKEGNAQPEEEEEEDGPVGSDEGDEEDDYEGDDDDEEDEDFEEDEESQDKPKKGGAKGGKKK